MMFDDLVEQNRIEIEQDDINFIKDLTSIKSNASPSLPKCLSGNLRKSGSFLTL